MNSILLLMNRFKLVVFSCLVLLLPTGVFGQTVSITSGDNPTCFGAANTVTLTIDNVLASTTYDLFWNGVQDGGFTTDVNGDAVAIRSTAGYAVGSSTFDITPSGGGTTYSTATFAVNVAATVSANIDQTVCASSPAVTLAGSIGGAAASSTWSTSGTGSFNDATSLTAVYTPSAADITAGTVTLTLTTDDPAGPCPSVNDAMTVTINSVATANANSDQTVCASSPAVTLAGSVGGSGSTIAWSTNGTGSFDNSASLTAVYTPSAADITAGTVTLTLTNDPSGPCATATDAMVVTINSIATADANTDQTVCASSPAVTLAGSVGGSGSTIAWSTSGTGSFDNSASLTAVYTPSAADITAGTVTLTLTNDPSGPCATATDNLVVTINSVATANANSDQTVCASSPAVTLAGSVGGSGSTIAWSTSGTGSFDNSASLTAVYTPSAGDITVGTVTLTLTNDPSGPCATATDNMIVTFNRIISGIITADQTICSGGDPGVFNEVAASTGDGVLTYRWELNTNLAVPSWSTIGGATATTYDAGVLTADAQYRKVTISTLNTVACEANSNTITVTVNNLTAGTVAADQTICSGGDPAAFTESSASTGDGTLTYRWELNTNIASPSWSTIGGATATTYDAGVLTADAQYRRVTISTLNAITCEATSNVITVTVNNLTAGVIAADQTICSGGDPAAFTETTAATADGTITYRWEFTVAPFTTWSTWGADPNSATIDAPIGMPEDYKFRRVTISTVNAVACEAISNTITVTVNNLTAGVIAGSQTICSGFDPAAFTESTASTSDGAITYRWEVNTNLAVPSWSTIALATSSTYDAGVLTATTQYRRVSISTLNTIACEAISNVLTVTVNQNPTASFTINDFDQCLTPNSYTVTNTSSNGTGTINAWVWSATGALPVPPATVGPHTFSYASAGLKTINLTVTDDNGCTNSTANSDNILVWSNPVAAFTVNDYTQCLIGNSFTLTNASTNGSSAITTWAWTTTDATNATETGVGPHTTAYAAYGFKTVNLTVTDGNLCTNATAYTNNITVFQHPTASFATTESSGTTNNDNIICTGAVVHFTGAASTYGFGASSLSYQYKVDGSNAGAGSTSSLYEPVVIGITNPDDYLYTLLVTDNNGCTNETSPGTHIYVHPYPVPAISTPTIGTQGLYGVIGDNGNGGQLLCHGKVVFDNTSTIPSGSIVTYLWSFGDATTTTTTTTENVKHEYPVNTGINWFDAAFPNTRYTIGMTATSNLGCVTSTSISRDIKNGPDAIINLTPSSSQPIATNSFPFGNGSQNRHPSFITSSLWDFGDGTSTTNQLFIPKVYTTAGDFRVHLITYTNTGCTDTTYMDVTVTPGASASFTYVPNICANKDVAFTSTSVSASTYLWDFGDASTSTSANPTHTYAANGSYVVTLTINGSIVSAPQTIVVATTPSVGAITSSMSACGNTYTFSNVSTGQTLTYAWTFGGAAVFTPTAPSTSSSISGTYGTAAAATVDLIVTADGRCPASATQLSFTSVAAGASVVAGVTVTAADNCTGDRTVNNTSTGGGTYELSVDGGAYATVAYPYALNGLSAGTHSVTIRVTNGSCITTATASFEVSVPTPSFSYSAATCGQTVAFTNTSTSTGAGTTTYSWNFNTGEGSSTSTSPSFTFATGGTKTVTLTATASSGCVASSTNAAVAVSAAAGPTAGFTSAIAAGTCANRIQFTNTSSGAGLTYTWDFGDGNTSTETSPLKGYGSAGPFTVTLTATNGTCTSVATASTSISSSSAGPAAGFTVNSTPQILASNNFNFFNTTQHMGFGWITSYTWNFGDATTSTNTFIYGKTYASAGTYTVTLTAVSSNGCTDVTQQTVVVTAAASAAFSASTNNCTNRDVTFTNTSVSSSSNSWNFGDGSPVSTSTSPTHTYAADGSYTVTLTINGSSSVSHTVVVATTPSVGAITSLLSACGNTYTFSNVSTGQNLTYAWSFGGAAVFTPTAPSTTSSISGTYGSAAAATVDLVVTADARCPASAAQLSFTSEAAGASVVAGVTVTAADYCTGDRTVNNTSTGGGTFELSIDAGAYATVAYPYALSGLSAGSHSVTIRVTNGSCITTASASFEVSVPTPAFTYSAATCGQAVAFTNTSTSTGSGTTTYSWNFNTGEGTSTSTSPSFTFATGGTKTVTLTATASSGCVASSTNAAVSVSAVAGPTASFTSAVAAGACANRIQFTNTSSGGGLTYTWDFGDGNTSTEASPLKGFGSAGPFTVTLTANNGTCTSTATASISVSSSTSGPAAGFTVNTVTQPLATNLYDFFNTSQHMGFGWNTSYTWNFGDATTSTNTFVYGKSYASAGTYTVTLTAVSSTGCTDITQQTVVVTATATAAFSASTNSCANRDVTFTNTSVSNTSNSWNFGDGSPASTSTSPTHTYAADGSYTVTLTINGSTSVSHTVVIATTPSVGAITQSMSACGNVYTFSNVSTGQTLTYAWTFGGVAVFTPTAPSTSSSISGTYGSAAAATVDLVVTADGRCPASAAQLSFTSVAAGASVVAGVTVTATTNFCADTRTVNNTSTGGGTYELSIDGGAYATVAYPYALSGLSAGTHTATIRVTNGACVTTATASFDVSVPTPSFTYSAASCGQAVAFTNTTTSTGSGTTTYSWNFNTGEGTSTSTSPSFTFATGGTKTVTLTATASSGCVASSTDAAVVVSSTAGPTASFTAAEENTGVCHRGILFTSTGTGAATYTWSFGDGTYSPSTSSTTIFHAYATTGTYSVTVTATSTGGCSTTSAAGPAVVTVTGYPVPEAGFTTPNSTQCITGNRYDLFNTTQLNGWGWVSSYSWDYGDGGSTVDDLNTFVYGLTYASAGTYIITLTATTNFGCTNTSSLSVTVNPTPCAPSTITDPIDNTYGGDHKIEGNNTSKASSINNANDISMKIGLYPNPNTGSFKLTLKEVSINTGRVIITDMLGRDVYNHTIEMKGRSEIEFSDLNLAPGKYSIMLTGENSLFARKSFAVIK